MGDLLGWGARSGNVTVKGPSWTRLARARPFRACLARLRSAIRVSSVSLSRFRFRFQFRCAHRVRCGGEERRRREGAAALKGRGGGDDGLTGGLKIISADYFPNNLLPCHLRINDGFPNNFPDPVITLPRFGASKPSV